MPPGRPRIYHTKEQLMQANREKNKRHYEGHRDEINKRRKRQRLKSKNSTGRDASGPQTSMTSNSPQPTLPAGPAQPEDHASTSGSPLEELSTPQPEQEDLSPADDARKAITDLETNLAKLMKNASDYVYLSKLCTHFEENYKKNLRAALDTFEYHLASCTRIKKDIQRCGDVITEEVGYCEDVSKAYHLGKRLEELITELDDLANSSLLGPAAFVGDYQRFDLGFQKLYLLRNDKERERLYT